uniref:Uncharacterized protein n=1 Tax=Pithovirus LCPAC103 TaxID=2506588 RepID=A0A481Z3J6_9VIRU|nr:MAG: hypothetical protein LCPAC103_01490 [Pithovirus LCPAC103]
MSFDELELAVVIEQSFQTAQIEQRLQDSHQLQELLTTELWKAQAQMEEFLEQRAQQLSKFKQAACSDFQQQIDNLSD